MIDERGAAILRQDAMSEGQEDQFAALRDQQRDAVIANQSAQLAFYAESYSVYARRNKELARRNKDLTKKLEHLDRYRTSPKLAAKVLIKRGPRVVAQRVRTVFRRNDKGMSKGV